MTQDLASLYIKVDSKGVVTAGKNLDDLTNKSGKTEKATDSLSKGFTKMATAAAAVAAAAAAAAAAFAAYKLVKLAQEATVLAARYETLGVVMRQVGNTAGYSSSQMDNFQKSLEETGISMIQSRNTLARMNQAQIDLNDSTVLGRIAQDAAVIGNINSSEAFERLIYGIQSAQTEMLRTIGINVNFNNGYKELAETLDKNITELTELEKVQSRVNTVMKASTAIAGTYDAAMDTAGKQMLSLQRHVENLKVLLGQAFTPALAEIVEQITAGIKGANDELSDTEAIEEWGTKLRLTLIDIESAVLKTQIALGKMKSGFPLFKTLMTGSVDLKDVIGLYAAWMESRDTENESATASEKALLALMEKRAALLESMSPEGRKRAQEEAEAAEEIRLAQAKIAKEAQAAADALDEDNARIEEATEAYEALQSELDPTLAKFREMVEVQATLKEALTAGVIGAGEYTEAWQKYLASVQAENDPSSEEAAKASEELLKAKIDLYEDLTGFEDEYRESQIEWINKIREAEIELGLDSVAAHKKATEAIAKLDQEAFERKSSQVDQSLGQMASAFQSIGSMYEQGSSEYDKMQQAAQAMIVLQNGVAVANAVAAIANQGLGDPYTATARIAAMVSTMAALLSSAGLSLGGGGGGAATSSLPSSTVLGAEAGTGSESIGNSFELMQDTYDMQFRELSALNSSMNDLNRNLSGLTANVIQTGSIGGFSISDPTENLGDELLGSFGARYMKGLTSLLNKAFGGGTTTSIISSGLALGSASLEDMAAGLGIDADSFALVKTVTDGGWFHSDKTSISRQTRELGDSTTDLLSSIYQDISLSLIELTTQLGADMTATLSYTFDAVDLNLRGKSAAQINETLQGYFSRIGDQAVEELFGSLLSGYQEVGEGLFETAMRLVVDKAIITDMLEKTGQAFTGTIPQMIEFSEALINLAGDLETLQDGFETFYAEFIPESERFIDLQTDLTGALSDLNSLLPDTREGYKDLVQGLDLTTESGQQAYVALLSLSEQAAEYYSQLEDLQDEQFSLQIELLEAQGEAEEALALARQAELDAMDPTLAAIQAQIWAQEELNDAMDTYTSITEALSAAIGDISGTGVASTQAGFNALFASAMGGDTEALAALPGAAQAFLAAAKQTSESELEYRRLQSQVLNKLGQAETFSASQLALLDASVPGHATGLSKVPYDGYLMKAHKDEAVLTAPEAARWRNQSSGNVTSLEEFRALRTELVALREVTESGNYQVAKNTQKISKILGRFDDDGMPAERQL